MDNLARFVAAATATAITGAAVYAVKYRRIVAPAAGAFYVWVLVRS